MSLLFFDKDVLLPFEDDPMSFLFFDKDPLLPLDDVVLVMKASIPRGFSGAKAMLRML